MSTNLAAAVVDRYRNRSTTIAPFREVFMPHQLARAAVEQVPILSGGKWSDSSTTRFGDVFNPSTGKVIARCPASARRREKR